MLLNYIYAFASSVWGNGFYSLVISIIDISLVYFFMYKFFVLIKGTRSVQILFGFFVLLILYFIGKIVDLRATEWLLSGFFSYFIIMVVVIFHDEIRSILSSFDVLQFFVKTPNTLDSYIVVEEISEALGYLASVKEGALMVVAQKGDPMAFITGGVMIDANVKKELLISIFRKNTPLHDGAIIIKDGKVKLASAVLPLSTNPDIDPNFGTRHRAAYGISEKVDSLVFVVSEERGQISMLLNGQITRNLSKSLVKRILTKYLKQEQ